MSNDLQPKPAKFKKRFSESVSEFGSQESEMETVETAKVLKRESVKTQIVEKTIGKTIRFPPDLHRYLKAYAGLHDRDVSDLVVEEMERFKANHPLI